MGFTCRIFTYAQSHAAPIHAIQRNFLPQMTSCLPWLRSSLWTAWTRKWPSRTQWNDIPQVAGGNGVEYVRDWSAHKNLQHLLPSASRGQKLNHQGLVPESECMHRCSKTPNPSHDGCDSHHYGGFQLPSRCSWLFRRSSSNGKWD